MSVLIHHTLQSFRSTRKKNLRLALVPTMGALHEGHLSLVRLAKEHADEVVVSIFVNPTQFAPHEDFASYPRGLEEDLAQLTKLKVAHAYVPDVQDLYPAGPRTMVVPGPIASKLEGQYRPHFFDGVATVVNKLLGGLAPDLAIFGEKDFQQIMVVRQMVEDCRLPCEILAAPTTREDDGLAMSSRNQYLDQTQRAKAAGMYKTLNEIKNMLHMGSLPVAQAPVLGAQMLLQAGFDKVDYVNLVDLPEMNNAKTYQQGQRLLAAAWLGNTRLIDNIEP